MKERVWNISLWLSLRVDRVVAPAKIENEHSALGRPQGNLGAGFLSRKQ
jgi:hypothetical protein